MGINVVGLPGPPTSELDVNADRLRHKVLWISFWATMVFWLGGAWGCAAVHVPLGGDDTRPAAAADTDMPTEAQAEILARAEDPGPVPATAPSLGEMPVEINPQTAPPMTAPRWGEADGSIDSLDRSDWIATRVVPVAGLVVHHATYHDDLVDEQLWIGSPRHAVAEEADAVAVQIVRAMADDESRALARRRWMMGALNPVKFAADSILMPLHVLAHRPWRREITPVVTAAEAEALLPIEIAADAVQVDRLDPADVPDLDAVRAVTTLIDEDAAAPIIAPSD